MLLKRKIYKNKTFYGFPKNSIDFCLSQSNLILEDIDLICVNYNKSYNFKEKIFFSLKNFIKVTFQKTYFPKKTHYQIF